jgi:hypothetical protein
LCLCAREALVIVLKRLVICGLGASVLLVFDENGLVLFFSPAGAASSMPAPSQEKFDAVAKGSKKSTVKAKFC